MAKIIIKNVMREKNIPVKQILPFLPYSRATVYRILNGTKLPSIDDLEEFARVLGVALEELYESEYGVYKKNLSQS